MVQCSNNYDYKSVSYPIDLICAFSPLSATGEVSPVREETLVLLLHCNSISRHSSWDIQ